MTIVAKKAFTGARGIDAVTLLSTDDIARRVRESQIDFAVQYLGSVTPEIVAHVTNAGLAFFPVTYADKFDGHATVQQLAALKLPKGVTTWLDVESVGTIDPYILQLRIDDWAALVDAAGYEPGMYVGPGAQLTSAELYRLKVRRYWRAGAVILDRNGQLAEPGCGYCMFQLRPSVTWGGVWSDIDFVQEDFRSRLPTWAVKENANG
jgi:hypothetical protein